MSSPIEHQRHRRDQRLLIHYRRIHREYQAWLCRSVGDVDLSEASGPTDRLDDVPTEVGR